MAIIVYGAPVDEVRGTIGGVTFSANRAGSYAKGWRRPTDPATPDQMAKRASINALPNAWRGLTTLQQNGWNTFATTPPETLTNSLGQTYTLSGYGWFCKLNARRLTVGQTILSAAPAATPATAPPLNYLVMHVYGTGPNAYCAYFSPNWPNATDYFILQLALATGPGQKTMTTHFHNLYAAQPGNGTGIIVYTTRGGEVFGQTQVGQRFFYRGWLQSQYGIRGTAVTGYTTIVA